MFIGEHYHTLDKKGRVSIPTRFRALLGEKFIIAKVYDNCLMLFPYEEWLNFHKTLTSLPKGNPKVRAFQRKVYSNATEAQIDKVGRVSIPIALREWANLNTDVVIIGNGKVVEIWNKETWKKYKEETEKKYEGFEEELSKLGI